MLKTDRYQWICWVRSFYLSGEKKWPEDGFDSNTLQMNNRGKNTMNHLLNEPKFAHLNPHPVCLKKKKKEKKMGWISL